MFKTHLKLRDSALCCYFHHRKRHSYTIQISALFRAAIPLFGRRDFHLPTHTLTEFKWEWPMDHRKVELICFIQFNHDGILIHRHQQHANDARDHGNCALFGNVLIIPNLEAEKQQQTTFIFSNFDSIYDVQIREKRTKTTRFRGISHRGEPEISLLNRFNFTVV